MVSSLATFGSLLLAASSSFAQVLSSSGCQPNDYTCYINKAQYTVLGTVVATNNGSTFPGTTTPGTPSNFTAEINIQCVWASASGSSGANIIGQTVPVTGFGMPQSACTNVNSGANATVNASSVFFLYVQTGSSNPPVMSLFDHCYGGGTSYTPDILQRIAAQIAKTPTLAIPAANSGPSQCALPAPPVTTTVAPASAATGGAATTSAPTPTGPIQVGSNGAGTRYAAIGGALLIGLTSFVSVLII
ncbi:hypothetical protein BDK51DRAFT_29759 [Blyttiomyces helicus]|uniref:Uncharacterized protein n=1 Tax=Blyttiomyces helicus TaxID=388810 RepID=A0A4P9W298_9FUNG|nr:hypothetical protein BDK51DRAFT_29759 [Blyttiomyces helicus]|eukprot:RKO86264.1 hypothetical protein BDK51DRAFT_29759 [Blyttiomyces helicus]